MSSQRATHRTALIEAAMRLISERGWVRVSAQEIASRAGVSNPMVNYYFGSLDNLLYETTITAYEESVTYWTTAASNITAVSSRIETAELRLNALTTAVLQWGEQHSGIAPLLTFPLFGPKSTAAGDPAPLTDDPRYIAATERHYRFILELVADLIDDWTPDGMPGHRSSTIGTSYEWTIFGAMSAWCGQHAYASEIDRQQFFEEVVATTVALVRAAAPSC